MIEDMLESLRTRDHAIEELLIILDTAALPGSPDYTRSYFKSRSPADRVNETIIYKEHINRKLLAQKKDRNKLVSECRRELLKIHDTTLRKIIYHKFYFHESWKTAASRYGLSEGAAKMRWKRYLKSLSRKE